MKITKSCCKVLLAVSAMAASCIAFGEINVMASRSYVDKKTSVSVVTNDNVEGYRIGSNTNFTFATHSSLTGLSNSIPGMIQEMAPAPGNYQVVSNAAMNARSMTDFSVDTNGWVMVWPDGTNSWMSPYQPGMWISGEAILQFDYEWWLNVPGMMYPIMSDSPSDAKELTFTVTGARPKTYRLYRGDRLALSSEIVKPDYSTSNQTLVDTITQTAPAPGNYQAVSNAAMSVSATNDYLRLDGNSDMTGPITFTGEGVISGGSSGVTIYAFGSTWYFNEWMPERVARYSDIMSYQETDPTVPAWAKAETPPYLTSYTETDPTVPAWAKVATPPYLTSFTEEDPLVGLTNGTIHIKGSSITPLTSFTETDPTVPAWAKVTTPPYLTSYTETDPTVPAWAKVSNPPYLTSYTETDPTVPSWAKVPTPPYLTSFTEEDPLVGLTNGTIYVRGETITPVTQSTVEGTARQIIFSTSQYMWDDADECLYWIGIRGGYTYQIPVTNVNALLPENSQVLQYIENHKEEFLND